MVLCECVFLDVSVTVSRATSTLVYEWPRRGAVFTLVFDIWCAHMEVSARKNHKTYAFALVEWSCPLHVSKLPCLHGKMQGIGIEDWPSIVRIVFYLVEYVDFYPPVDSSSMAWSRYVDYHSLSLQGRSGWTCAQVE